MTVTGSGFYAASRRRRISGVVLIVLLLCLLTWTALFTVTGQNLDNLAMEALVGRSALLPQRLQVATSVVSVPALAAVSVMVAVVAVLRRRPALALRAVAVVAGANLTTQVAKYLISRPDLGVSLHLENSYPSGHVTFAASVAIALILVAPVGTRSAATLCGWAWTTVMGVVVISQGWHRLSDVLGAILIVALWGFATAPIEERRRVISGLVVAGTWLAWLLLVAGAAAFVVGAGSIAGGIGHALSQTEIRNLIVADSTAGMTLALAAMLLPTGLAAVTMNALDRFSGM